MGDPNDLAIDRPSSSSRSRYHASTALHVMRRMAAD